MTRASDAHLLKWTNPATRTGECATCRIVRIVRRGDGRWRCATAAKQARGKTTIKRRAARAAAATLNVRTPCCDHPTTLPPLLAPTRPGPCHTWYGTHACPCGRKYLIERERRLDTGHQPTGQPHRETSDLVKWLAACDSHTDGAFTDRETYSSYGENCTIWTSNDDDPEPDQ